MTSESYFEQQAKSNEKAARSIEDDYPDWAVTMCFYAALYWLNHHAAQRGEILKSHDDRRKYLDKRYELSYEKRDMNLRKLYDNLYDIYNKLHGASEKARYFASSSHNKYVQPIRYSSAINYFKSHKSEVNAAFTQLQQIRDLLSKINKIK